MTIITASGDDQLLSTTSDVFFNSVTTTVPFSALPVGTILDFAGNSLPSGFLSCDGTVYNISSYPNLFSIISNIWGGDGITTFAVPNLSRSVCMGSGGTGTTVIGSLVGNIGGEESHAQTTNEMAQHTHTVTVGDKNGQLMWHDGLNIPNSIASTPANGAYHIGGSVSVSLQNSGNSVASNIIQPSVIVNKIIRT